MQNQALLGREAELYDRLLRWLRAAAKASMRRQITFEEELPNGRYLVCEEWPSKAAYLELAMHRKALEAMLNTEERARIVSFNLEACARRL
jgi:hypothetical protein